MDTKISLKTSVKKYWSLYLILFVPLLHLFLFRYLPMYGIILSVKKYVPGHPFGTTFVGLKYFERFLTDSQFWNVFKNTLTLSVMALLIGFPIPVIFAILLNEVSSTFNKKFVQTVSYLPKFLSVIIVVMMINALLSPSTGIINNLIESLGGNRIHFVNEASWFRTIYITSDIWQFTGWNAILYIAALGNIDEQLYEAASLDGVNRFQKIIHVTIPGILPTIVITFILAIGSMMMNGFEKILLLYSPSTYSVADVIQTYVYRIGLQGNNFSYATAVGLFQSVIALLLLWGTNRLAAKYTDYSLW